MNIMGIRKVIKPPNYVSVYDLRVQDRIKKKNYCVPTSTLKQTHFGTLITGVNQLIPRFRLGDVVGTSSHSWKILITNSIYRCDNWLVRCYWAFRNLTEVSTTFWDSRLIKKSIYNYHSFPWTISQLSLHWKEKWIKYDLKSMWITIKHITFYGVHSYLIQLNLAMAQGSITKKRGKAVGKWVVDSNL